MTHSSDSNPRESGSWKGGSGLGSISRPPPRSSETTGADTGRAPSISTVATRTDPVFLESSPYQALVELLEVHQFQPLLPRQLGVKMLKSLLDICLTKAPTPLMYCQFLRS